VIGGQKDLQTYAAQFMRESADVSAPEITAETTETAQFPMALRLTAAVCQLPMDCLNC